MSNLKYKPFTKEEKLKCMDRMLKYIKDKATSVQDPDDPRDIYSTCKTMAVTELFDFVADHVIE